MKKNYYLIALSLLISLFIYLFYRTEKTVVTEIFSSIISLDQFIYLRKSIKANLALNQLIIFSLPEGLWVFCITLTSKFMFIKLGKYMVNLVFAPLLFAVGLEIFQLLHLTNGRFDFWDIAVSIFFWVIGAYLINNKNSKQNMLYPFNKNSLICLLSYAIVYLAHVWE